MHCHDCQTKLLELAYDLIDAPEAQALRAHVQACPTCTQAWNNTRALQTLFGQAARLPMAAARFEPPMNEPARPPRHATRSWLPWTIAASVLLAIGVIGTPIMQHYFDRGREVAKIKTGTDKSRPPVAAVPHGRSLLETASGEWTVSGAGFRCIVLGPEKPSERTPADYSFTAVDDRGAPLALRITLLVKDAEGKIIGEKQTFETPGTFSLSADLLKSVPPGSATLHVFATHPTTSERAEIKIPLK